MKRCRRDHEMTADNSRMIVRRGKPVAVCRTCERDRMARKRLDPEYREGEKLRKRNRRVEPLAPGDPRHGTLNGYNWHKCRCELCKLEVLTVAWLARRQQGIDERPRQNVWTSLTLELIIENVGDEWDDPTFDAVCELIGV